MTITIDRPAWPQRLTVSLGLAAILVAAVFVVFQNTGSNPVASIGTVNMPTARQALVQKQALNGMTSTAAFTGPQRSITARRGHGTGVAAAITVTSVANPWKALQAQQNSYLPDTVTSADTDHYQALQAQQDSYLPDALKQSPIEGESFDSRMTQIR